LNNEYFEISFRLVAALAAGGIIGLERSYRGRAAGFRTHALVCLASSLLMLVTVYEHQWFSAQSVARVVVDPTRMAQNRDQVFAFGAGGSSGRPDGAMTTAASIWITRRSASSPGSGSTSRPGSAWC
jgi:putative Mg2+ transporter-C (MgtC) family protein